MFFIVALILIAGQPITGGKLNDAQFTNKAACEAARPVAEKALMDELLKSANEFKKDHPEQAKEIDEQLEKTEIKTQCFEQKK